MEKILLKKRQWSSCQKATCSLPGAYAHGDFRRLLLWSFGDLDSFLPGKSMVFPRKIMFFPRKIMVFPRKIRLSSRKNEKKHFVEEVNLRAWTEVKGCFGFEDPTVHSTCFFFPALFCHRFPTPKLRNRHRTIGSKLPISRPIKP